VFGFIANGHEKTHFAHPKAHITHYVVLSLKQLYSFASWNMIIAFAGPAQYIIE
jgi:hypothetical protein